MQARLFLCAYTLMCVHSCSHMSSIPYTSTFMCLCTCLVTRVCLYACTHKTTCVCVCVHVHVCVYIYIYIHTYTCIHMPTLIMVTHGHDHIHIHALSHTHSCLYMASSILSCTWFHTCLHHTLPCHICKFIILLSPLFGRTEAWSLVHWKAHCPA